MEDNTNNIPYYVSVRQNSKNFALIFCANVWAQYENTK